LRGRSSIRNNLEYAATRFVLATLAFPPRPCAEILARGYARLLDIAIPRLRRIARRNLSMALRHLSEAEREAMIDGVFRSIARLLVAFSRFPSINSENVSDWIRYEGFEYFEEARRKGKGVLFATAHLGNWELSAFAHALMARPMSVVVRPLDNPKVDALVTRYRCASGNRVIDKKNFARGILKALAANEAVGILIDQNTSLAEGVFVDYFGIPACTHPGFVRMAAHSGAAVIPGFALWSEREGRYILRFYPPVEISGDGVADTQRLQSSIEAAVREYADQWLWIHRRWKTRSPGEPPLY